MKGVSYLQNTNHDYYLPLVRNIKFSFVLNLYQGQVERVFI